MKKITKKTPLLSVLIPVFNEEKTIEKIINKIRESKISSIEIIVIDDASTDKTREILNKIKNKIDDIILKDFNGGKGSSIREGIKKATGDIVIFQDADLEYDPSEYPKLIQPIIDGRADVVYGSRFIGSKAHRVVYFWHFVANTLLTLLSNMFTNLNLTDMETCYKAFRKEIIKSINIKENSFGIEPEITAKVSKMKARIYEVGISYHGRTYEEGKKIGLKDVFIAVWAIIKYNILEN